MFGIKNLSEVHTHIIFLIDFQDTLNMHILKTFLTMNIILMFLSCGLSLKQAVESVHNMMALVAALKNL